MRDETGWRETSVLRSDVADARGPRIGSPVDEPRALGRLSVDVAEEAPIQSGLRRFFDPRQGSDRGFRVRLLSDEPIADAKRDFFGYAAFAVALAEIIDNEQTATPLTIALSAPWGAGKTSVAKMIEGDLRKRVADRSGAGKRIVCHFNAWDHDDADHLGAALAARVARVANRHRPRWRRLWEPLPSTMLEPRERWGRVVGLAVIAAVLACVLVAFSPTRDLAETVLEPKGEALAGIFGALWLVGLVWGTLYKAGRNATRFIDDPGSEAARGAMVEVKTQLGKLIRQATRGGRMVIFVDDLERCRAAHAVEVFEVAGQLLSHQGVVTVLLADMRSLEQAAKVAYEAETGNDDPRMGRRYLEKLVQLELQLPPPAIDDMRRLLGGDEPSGREGLQTADAKSEPRPGDAASTTSAWLPYVVAVGSIVTAAALVVTGAEFFDALFFGTVVGAGILGPIGILTGRLLAVWERHRRRRVVRRVLATLRDHPDSLSDDDEESDELVRKAAGGKKYEQLAYQVRESMRTIESPELKDVEAVIKRYPPRFPRGAKRMLNHARLLTKIAREREMFGGEPELTPAHLGKWIAIGERWPEFAGEVVQTRTRMNEVERSRRPGSLSTVQLPKNEAGGSDREFTELIDEEPRLADVIERLIYFTPAAEAVAEEPEPVSDPVVS